MYIIVTIGFAFDNYDNLCTLINSIQQFETVKK